MNYKLVILLTLVSCSQSPVRTSLEIHPLEKVPASEAPAIKEILGLVKAGYGNSKPKAPEDQGCVKAEFKILRDIPSDFRHGVFVDVEKTYPAWIRLSNDNKRPDGRSLTIKLMGVEGPKLGDESGSQDFLFQSAPNFFAKDVADYVKFMKRGDELSKKTKLHKRKKRASIKVPAESAPHIKHPLSAEYFSALPQLIGPQAMKLHAGPCPDSKLLPTKFFARFKDDFMRKILSAQLEDGDACIEISVQVQKDDLAMPIENALIPWDTRLSPFIPVAQILIPKQDFLTEKRKQFCENISFNPWHAIPEHRPLGGINRVRKLVYEQAQKPNKHSSSEPSPDDKE
ncbi:MAG TPA: hypothetical protein VNJ08_11895 [Bacteriovoracaceae bacterium]|nr:hypothetical protein [Bacteriovoracaceae bacterium]